MQDWLAAHEPEVRLGVFLSILVAMAIWEVASPRRRPSLGRRQRWTANLSLAVIDTAVLRVAFPIG